ncbi:MAG: serine/threonine-protein kinase [Polyangiales bacterium]
MAPPSSTEPVVGSELIASSGARYRIDARIGSGGMGAVYRALDVARNTPVAIKITAPELRAQPGIAERFANEATAMSRIASEHVVKVLASETTLDGIPFLVMELLVGRDLDAVIEQAAPMDPPRAVHLALQMLRGLQVAHAAGVIHRDVKPRNAFVLGDDHAQPGEREQLKLIDFGITKLLDDTQHLTRTATSLGTPSYMSPEQAKNAKAADARSDLYSVGVILYEMLTRKRPFSGGTASEIITKITTEPPLPVLTARPDLNPALAAVIERALVKNPTARYASAELFASALRLFADERSAGVLGRIDSGTGSFAPPIAAFVTGAASATPPPTPVFVPAMAPTAPAQAFQPRAATPIESAPVPSSRGRGPWITIVAVVVALVVGAVGSTVIRHQLRHGKSSKASSTSTDGEDETAKKVAVPKDESSADDMNIDGHAEAPTQLGAPRAKASASTHPSASHSTSTSTTTTTTIASTTATATTIASTTTTATPSAPTTVTPPTSATPTPSTSASTRRLPPRPHPWHTPHKVPPGAPTTP